MDSVAGAVFIPGTVVWCKKLGALSTLTFHPVKDDFIWVGGWKTERCCP